RRPRSIPERAASEPGAARRGLTGRTAPRDQGPRRGMTSPLVTCIMPTRDRRRFVGQAVAYFLRQDYPAKELIVVDDGGDPIADLVPEDERIRSIRLHERRSLGAKRNLACEVARGSLIAHWDDDDWFAPDRISCQVAELLRANALVCGTREALYYHLDAGQAWRYSATDGGRPWLHGATLL